VRPTDCPKCEEFFTPILQAEAGMELAKSGARAARVLVDERLEAVHAEHKDPDRT